MRDDSRHKPAKWMGLAIGIGLAFVAILVAIWAINNQRVVSGPKAGQTSGATQ